MLSSLIQLFNRILAMIKDYSVKKEHKVQQEQRAGEIELVKKVNEQIREEIQSPNPDVDEINKRFGWDPKDV